MATAKSSIVLRALIFTLLTAALGVGSALAAVKEEKKQQQHEPARHQAKTAAAASPSSQDYVIGIEDIIEIAVWKNPEVSKTVMVRPDGMITLPLVGDIRAAGNTPSQLRDTINDRMKEFQDTVVTSVIVQEVKSYRIFVLGEVMNPGTYTMMRKTSVLQAIALAGGFNQFASRKIVLIREGMGAENKPEKVSINFDDIVDSDAKKDRNLILKPGDTVFVQ